MISLKRRNFLKNALVFAAYTAAASELRAAGDDTPAEKPAGFKVLPYLQNPRPDGMTVMWHTEMNAYGWIEYGESHELGNMADLVIDGLRNANTILHKVSLENLKPGHVYYYRACFKRIKKFGPYAVDFDATISSPVYSFRTISEQANSVKCALFNDIHRNFDVFGQLAKRFSDRECEFTFFNGDCFPDYSDDDGMLAAMDLYNRGTQGYSYPMIHIRGNHETRGAFARGFKAKLDFPEGQYYFAMSAGPVRFIVLDCGEDKDDSNKAYSGLNDFSGFRARQAEWLKREIKSDGFLNAKFRVLVHHIPLYQRSDRGISAFSRKLWEPVLNDAPIDLAVCGHIHRYNYVPVGKAGNHYPVIVGGGPNKSGTLIIMDANAKELKLEVLDVNGNRIGHYAKSVGGDMKILDV